MEQYTYVDQKRLRMGYTTGSCAAAAAKAAALMLLSGCEVPTINLMTPKGYSLSLEVRCPERSGDCVRCAIQKDSGDDPDITDGILVFAAVRRAGAGIAIEGGEGVGRVTRPGLECPVGAPAINSTPRRMIEQAVREVCEECGYPGGLSVTISIPGGEALAAKTYNPRLGIVDGLSILGTSGIVEPMSERGLVDSIKVEMNVLQAAGVADLVVTPGNYGEVYARTQLGLALKEAVKCSNFIGEVLDYVVQRGFKSLLLIGHLGKLVKLAGGVFNTHSRYADCRMEILAAHSALAGADGAEIKRMMDCITTDEAWGIVESSGLWEPVIQSLLKKIDFHLRARTHNELEVGAVVFSNRWGTLGMTSGAQKLIQKFKQAEEQA